MERCRVTRLQQTWISTMWPSSSCWVQTCKQKHHKENSVDFPLIGSGGVYLPEAPPKIWFAFLILLIFFETVFFLTLLLQVLHPLSFQSLVKTFIIRSFWFAIFRFIWEWSRLSVRFNAGSFFPGLSSVSNSRLLNVARGASYRDSVLPDLANSPSLMIDHDSLFSSRKDFLRNSRSFSSFFVDMHSSSSCFFWAT